MDHSTVREYAGTTHSCNMIGSPLACRFSCLAPRSMKSMSGQMFLTSDNALYTFAWTALHSGTILLQGFNNKNDTWHKFRFRQSSFFAKSDQKILTVSWQCFTYAFRGSRVPMQQSPLRASWTAQKYVHSPTSTPINACGVVSTYIAVMSYSWCGAWLVHAYISRHLPFANR